MELQLLLLTRWECDSDPTPGPRAIESPTPTALPAPILYRFLRHQLGYTVAMARFFRRAFSVM